MNYDYRYLENNHPYHRYFRKLRKLVFVFTVSITILLGIGYFILIPIIQGIIAVLQFYFSNIFLIFTLIFGFSSLYYIFNILFNEEFRTSDDSFVVLIGINLTQLTVLIFAITNHMIINIVSDDLLSLSRLVENFYNYVLGHLIEIFILIILIIGILFVVDRVLQLLYEKVLLPRYLDSTGFRNINDLQAAAWGGYDKSKTYYEAMNIGNFNNQSEYFFFLDSGFKDYDEFVEGALQSKYQSSTDFDEANQLGFPNSETYYSSIDVIRKYGYPTYNSYIKHHDQLTALRFQSYDRFEELADTLIKMKYPSVVSYDNHKGVIEEMGYPDFPTYKKYHKTLVEYGYTSFKDYNNHHSELVEYGFDDWTSYIKHIDDIKRIGVNSYDEFNEIMAKMDKYGIQDYQEYLKFWEKSTELDTLMYNYIKNNSFKAQPISDIIKRLKTSEFSPEVIEHVWAEKSFSIHQLGEIDHSMTPTFVKN